MRKSWLLALCVVLAAVFSIGGTVAYLSDTDADVNVMTLGNVQISQIERQHPLPGNNTVPDDDGLVPFENDKPIIPGVYDSPSKDEDGFYASSVSNAVDKIVSVENTGNSAAWVRTWFAFEQGTMSAEDFAALMLINRNNAGWTWSEPLYDQTVTIDGVEKNCVIYSATYNEPLEPGDVTKTSLRQVLLSKDADNNDVNALSADGKYTIEVVSQAVQAAGFDDAKTALNAAFGAAYPGTNAVPPEAMKQVTVSTNDELKAALSSNEPYHITLAANILYEAESEYVYPALGVNKTIDLNGKTLKLNKKLSAENGAVLKVTDNGGNGMLECVPPYGGLSIMKDSSIYLSNLKVYNKDAVGYLLHVTDTDGTLVIENCSIEHGMADTNGNLNSWPIYSDGNVEIRNTTITVNSKNSAVLARKGSVSITDSTIQNIAGDVLRVQGGAELKLNGNLTLTKGNVTDADIGVQSTNDGATLDLTGLNSLTTSDNDNTLDVSFDRDTDVLKVIKGTWTGEIENISNTGTITYTAAP